MAKLAGRKNAGAWQRFNNVIRSLPEAAETDLANSFSDLETVTEYFAAITAHLDDLGVSDLFPYTTVAGWTAAWCSLGIPYDVWMGKVSYDIYQETGEGTDNPVYKGVLAPFAAKAGIDVRDTAKKFEAILFQIRFWTLHSPPSSSSAVRAAAVKAPAAVAAATVKPLARSARLAAKKAKKGLTGIVK